jgi:phenol 2-monooxygenase
VYLKPHRFRSHIFINYQPILILKLFFAGSAGLCAAAWLARCGVRCKIVDSRSGPLDIGQADGVQCRTVEVFDSFGIAEELLREAYHVLEVNFWGSSDAGISRTRRTADTMPGLSHHPHVILNQARVNGMLLDAMRRFNGQIVDYGYNVKSVQVDSQMALDPDAYPVTVVTEKGGKEEMFQAKYVLVSISTKFEHIPNIFQGCDGAHSAVRKSLGYKMVGDSTDAVWGVMDVYPQTDFPDIRKKAVLQSHWGTLMIIPREGGSLTRFYIELPVGTKAKDVTLDDLCSTARKIFHPYRMDFGGVFWWSAYVIGQRLADNFSKDNRVFLTGDACHTHSPKAGQGMNTSLQDGYNIGWKLAAVIKGQAHRDLLETYIIERQKVAADLIAFDREFARMMHSKTTNGNLKQDFSDHFIKSGRYMAGLTATYDDSSITRAQWSTQSLATNLKVGMRFPSTQVVRFCDAKAMQLVKALPADGRWRIVIFAGDIRYESSAQRLKKVNDIRLVSVFRF